jgi:HK97 family phage major capsid protein
MDTVQIENLQNEIKEQLAKIQSVVDEKATAMETKSVETVEKLKVEQKQMVDELESKISALEKITAQLAGAKTVSPEDEAYTEMFKKSLNAMNKKLGRPVQDVTAEQIREYNENLYKYVTRGEKAMTPEEMKSINTMNDAEGGYLVVPQVDPSLVNKKFDGHGLLEACGKRTTSGIYEVIVDFADYDKAYFTKEMPEDASLSDEEDFAKITFNNDVIKYGKKFSRVALEDSLINVEADVLGKMRAGMARKVGDYCVSGNGGANPRGILTYASGTTFGKIEQITSGTSGKLTFADVISKLPSALKDGYHANASFIMRRATFFGLLAEADQSGKLQIDNMVNLFSAQGLSFNLLGYPVHFDSAMPAVASNALAVAFGDFNEGYILTTTPTVGIVRNETHPDYVQIWQRERHDGKVVNFEAIKLLKIQ